jgi:hypothetical protein
MYWSASPEILLPVLQRDAMGKHAFGSEETLDALLCRKKKGGMAGARLNGHTSEFLLTGKRKGGKDSLKRAPGRFERLLLVQSNAHGAREFFDLIRFLKKGFHLFTPGR